METASPAVSPNLVAKILVNQNKAVTCGTFDKSSCELEVVA